MLNPAKRPTAIDIGSALDRLFRGGRALCDGAMGTMLLSRGISMDRCYDQLNLVQPETVASIHAAYLEAGAEIVETNTFGANAFRLERHDLRNRVREINLAGVRIARQCVARSEQTQTAKASLAGAIGPLGVRLTPDGSVARTAARAAFAEQIRALSEGGPGVGVDLLMLETMTSLAEAGEAVRAAQEVASRLPIVVMMTIGDDGNCLDGTSVAAAAVRLTELGADAVGCNCSNGPESVLLAIERMRGATHLPLAAMPNAGLPNVAEGLTTYPLTPAEMAGFTRKFLQAGVSLMAVAAARRPATRAR